MIYQALNVINNKLNIQMGQRMDLQDMFLQNENFKVTIYWATKSVERIDYFAIERSLDGWHWSDLDSICDLWKSDASHNYSLTDDSPFLGTSYYRLKYRNADGAFEYFPPLTAICNKKGAASEMKSVAILVGVEQ
jgi:hypothetical protein